MSVPEPAWREAVAVIESAPQVALAPHVGPDGDALGSMLALGLALRTRGIEAVWSWSEPFTVPRHYDFLPGLELAVPPGEFPEAPPVLVAFDTGSPDRLGTLEPAAAAATRVVVVDHHASGEAFGHVRLVDPRAAASAIITYELIRRLGVPFDRDIATCLYTGIVTDTGAFKYSNTTPDVLRVAADLLAHRVPHDEIVRRVYDTHPVGFLKLAAEALGRAAVIEGGPGLIWTWITQDDLRRHGLGLEDTEALIDWVRTAAEAEVACVLKEQPDGRQKVSLRAKAAADVGAVAASFGGGGHRLAAGFTASDGDRRAIVAAVAARLGIAGS